MKSSQKYIFCELFVAFPSCLTLSFYFLFRGFLDMLPFHKQQKLMPLCRYASAPQKNKLLHHPRQHNTCYNTRYCCEDRPSQRIPRFCHLCRHIINGHGIENRFRTAHHNRGCHTNQGIRSMRFKDIEHEPRCGRRRKHFDQNQRNQFRGKSELPCDAREQAADKIQKTGCTQYAYRHHKSDQCRHDLYDRMESVFCSFDKFLIHVRSDRNTICYDIEYNNRYYYIGKMCKNLCHRKACINLISKIYAGSFLFMCFFQVPSCRA